jgi:hypothetical protein
MRFVQFAEPRRLAANRKIRKSRNNIGRVVSEGG